MVFQRSWICSSSIARFLTPLLLFLVACLIITPATCLGWVQQTRETPQPDHDASTKKTPEESKQRSTSGQLKFAQQFWQYLLSNNYKHWSPPQGKQAELFTTDQAAHPDNQRYHTELAKIYVNRIVAGQAHDLPEGSVLVMENYRKDRSLVSISVMYRSPGFNPSANDWFWAQYAPDGSVMRMVDAAPSPREQESAESTFVRSATPVRLMGRANACIACHRNSKRDFAFFNDPKTTPPAITAERIDGRLESGVLNR